MTTQDLIFDLVTPERSVSTENVKMAVVPGTQGNIGTLKGHEPMITTLRPGIIELYSENEKLLKKFFVTGGFAEITEDRCVVMAPIAVNTNNIDKKEAEILFDKAKKDREVLKENASLEAIAVAENNLLIAETRLAAAS